MTINYSLHAAKRMLERGITTDCIESIVHAGRVIETYPDDKPFASQLLLGYCDGLPIHMVLVKNLDICTIITTYIPDALMWNEDFTKKLKL